MLLKVFKILNKNLSKKMVCIYVLQLEGGKWYVGKTDNPGMRLEDHKKGHGSQWTRKYNPVKVKKIVPDCDEYDEDKYTLKYMKETWNGKCTRRKFLPNEFGCRKQENNCENE